MVRTKDKKAKGDDAFKKQKQKIGRKKLAPATATQAEVHARTLRIIKPSSETSSPIGQQENRRNGSATSAELDKYRPERTLKENIVGAMHYREVTRSSSFTALHMTLDRHGRDITPLNHMQLLNVSLGAVTDTAADVREKALALFIKILRLYPSMHHDGVKHIFSYIQIALTHASIGVRKAGLKMVGEFLKVWPGSLRKAFAHDIISHSKQINGDTAANTNGSQLYDEGTDAQKDSASSATYIPGSSPIFVLEQVIDWATQLACNTNVSLQHHVMPVIAKLLEECLPLCASFASSAGELAHNLKKKNNGSLKASSFSTRMNISSLHDLGNAEYDPAVILSGDRSSPYAYLFPNGGILSVSYLERYYDRFQYKWTSQWKELMELQYKVFRDGISIERIHAVSRCFACVTLALKRHGRLTRDRAKLLKELFIHRIPFSMGELVNTNSASAKRQNVVQLGETDKRPLEEESEKVCGDAVMEDEKGSDNNSSVGSLNDSSSEEEDNNSSHEEETDKSSLCEENINTNTNFKKSKKKKNHDKSRNMRIDEDNTMKLSARSAILNVEAMKGKNTDRVKVINNLNGPERFSSTAKKKNTTDFVRTQNSLVSLSSNEGGASAYQAVAESICWCLIPIATTSEKHHLQQLVTNKKNNMKEIKKLKNQKRGRESEGEVDEENSHCAITEQHEISVDGKKFEPKDLIKIVISSGRCKLESCVQLMECTLGLFPQLYSVWTSLLSRGIFARLSGPLMLNVSCVSMGSDVTEYSNDAIVRGDSVNIIRNIISSIHLLCRFLRYTDGLTSSGGIGAEEQSYSNTGAFHPPSGTSKQTLFSNDKRCCITIQGYKDIASILQTILPRLLFTLRNYTNDATTQKQQSVLQLATGNSAPNSSITPQQPFIPLGGYEDYYNGIEGRMKRIHEVNEILNLALREYHRCVSRGHPVLGVIGTPSTTKGATASLQEDHHQLCMRALRVALKPLYGMKIPQKSPSDGQMTIVAGPLEVCSAETKQLANHLFYYLGEYAPEILSVCNVAGTAADTCSGDPVQRDIEYNKAKEADIWLLTNYQGICSY